MIGEESICRNVNVYEEQTNEILKQTKFHITPKNNKISSFDIWIEIKEPVPNCASSANRYKAGRFIANSVDELIKDLETEGII